MLQLDMFSAGDGTTAGVAQMMNWWTSMSCMQYAVALQTGHLESQNAIRGAIILVWFMGHLLAV